MIIEHDKVPAISFELTVNGFDGELVEDVKPDKPFEFLYGHGALLPAFETNLLGLKAGDDFKFLIPSSEGFGAYDEEMVVELDKSIFLDENGHMMDDIDVDHFIPMTDDNGDDINGKVLSINENTVTMDFNHPLADFDLYFTGSVISVRNGSPAEIERGHVEVAEHTYFRDAGPDDANPCAVD